MPIREEATIPLASLDNGQTMLTTFTEFSNLTNRSKHLLPLS